MSERAARVEQFFSGAMVECWRDIMPEEVTRQEVDFLEAQLKLAKSARVLDVPCGPGRHSCELAARGHEVSGVDLSSTCLNEARALANRKGVSVSWEHRDMTELPWKDYFDGAFLMGNSFGYCDDEQDAHFLAAVANALKPGCRFVMDYPVVAEALLPNFQERTWYEFPGGIFLRNGRYNPVAGRIETEYAIIRDGRIERKEPWRQRVYTYREVCRLLSDAGFVDVRGYASKSLEPFKLGSTGLLLVATRKVN